MFKAEEGRPARSQRKRGHQKKERLRWDNSESREPCLRFPLTVLRRVLGLVDGAGGW